MCIIVAKYKGYAFPNEETLKRCFVANPDGAGFAWSDEVQTYWKKGFETFESFYTAFKEVFPDETAERKYAAVLHFRIGTHGPKTASSHTHPFPVDAKTLQDTCTLEGKSKMVLFHNGVIGSIMSTPHEKVVVNGDQVEPSDSQILTYYYIKPLDKAYKNNTFSAQEFDYFVRQLIGVSKIALLEAGSPILRYGKWIENDTDYPGCAFSNSSYEKPKILPSVSYRVPFSAYSKNFEDDYGDNEYFGNTFGADSSLSIQKHSDYWAAYEKWFRMFPDGTHKEFMRYWNNRSKSSIKQTGSKIARPFWGVASSGYKNFSKTLVKVPEGSLISLINAKEPHAYCQATDKELYYEVRPGSGLIFLYVKNNKYPEARYYFISACKIQLPIKEIPHED